MHNQDTAIDVRNVSFSYVTPVKVPLFKRFHLPFKKVIHKKNVALRNVTIRIRKNRITALLGRNGSGKTTLIKVITGARFPAAGTVTVFGQAPGNVRSKIGLCLGGSLIYRRLSGLENLQYFGRLYDVPHLEHRIEELGELLGLHEHLDQLVESYSFGMKVKLALARSIIHSPELLILDEPTLGIDLYLANQLRDFIQSLNCTVLLTTHYMEEADALAEDVCIIDKGSIRASGTKEEVLKRYEATSIPEVFIRATSGFLPQGVAA